METGIILRSGEKLSFTYNVLKENELVFATDTKEIGFLVNGEIHWQEWDSWRVSNYVHFGDDEPTDDIGTDGDVFVFGEREFKKENGSWREIKWGVSDEQWLEDNLEPNFHSSDKFPYIGKYSYSMVDGYYPQDDLDVATKEYLDDCVEEAGVDKYFKLDGSTEFEVDYTPQEDQDVATQSYLESGVLLKLPSYPPCVEGALWNDNGTLRLSKCEGIVRYYTTEELGWSDGITRPVTNGYT